MFWNKKEKPKPKKQIGINTLIIHTEHGDFSWTTYPVTMKDGRIGPWRGFYTWYFGRVKSDSYVMRYDKGEIMIQRKNIRSFEVRIGTKFVDVQR